MSFIAILRGINVSGKNMVRMSELQRVLEQAGFRQVRTYIQSGNVLLESDETGQAVLEARIKAAIAEAFGFNIPVLVRDRAEWEAVARNNPFVNTRNEAIDKLHVTFLAAEPAAEKVEQLAGLDFAPEEFMLSGRTVYLFCPNGYGNAKLTNNFLENKLKVGTTTRNWKTVLALLELAGS